MHRHLRTALTLAPATALAFAALACQSELTGNEGNLLFSYVADDNVLDFNKPVAPGARLDIAVRETGTRQNVTLNSATTDSPDVMTVATFEGHQMTVEGVNDGNVLIMVEATKSDGSAVTDSVNMNVATPTVLTLKHSCQDEGVDTGHYLVDDKFWLRYDMERDNGQPVIGYGYHPVEFDPAEPVTLDSAAKDQQWLHLTSGPNPGTVQVKSTIDDTAYTMILVDPADITGGVIAGDYGALVATPTWYYVLPTIEDGSLICQADTPISINVTTPEICEVTLPSEGPDEDDVDAAQQPNGFDTAANSTGYVRVVGSQVGVCEFDVTFDAGNAGAGATASVSVDIVEVDRPNDGTNNGEDDAPANNGG